MFELTKPIQSSKFPVLALFQLEQLFLEQSHDCSLSGSSHQCSTFSLGISLRRGHDSTGLCLLLAYPTLGQVCFATFMLLMFVGGPEDAPA